MAIQPVPNYTPVPTPVIQRGDRETFSNRVDTFISWLQVAPPQFKALSDVTYNNANEAATSADAAADSAIAAGASEVEAAESAAISKSLAPITSATPPVNPAENATWINANTGREYTYLAVTGGFRWVETKASIVYQSPTSAEDQSFTAGGTGAVARSTRDKLREVVSVKDFGAKGDGVTDDTAAFQAAISYFNTGAEVLTGGVVNVPRGTYKLSGTLYLTNSHVGKVASITLRGEGQNNTILDFASAPVLSDGLVIPGATGITIADLFVRNAPRRNIAVYGVSSNDAAKGAITTNASFVTLKGVRTQGAGSSGLFLSGCYLSEISGVLALANGTYGIEVDGYNTTTNFYNCWARNNTLSGWKLNDMTYSELSGCASDDNGQHGYRLTNMHGVIFSGCGAESNQFDGISAEASTVIAAGMTAPDIKGVVVQSFFAFSNGLATTGYANLVQSNALNARPLEMILDGCVDMAPPAGRSSGITSGTALVARRGCNLTAAFTVGAGASSPVFGNDSTMKSIEVSDFALVRGPSPVIAVRETDAPANEGFWDVVSSAGQLLFRGRNDALSTQENFYAVDRTGQNITTHQWFASGTERMRLANDGTLSHRANATVVVDANSHLGLRAYTVATLPSATVPARMIYVSDGAANKRLAVSDGTNWRWPDGAIVS